MKFYSLSKTSEHIVDLHLDPTAYHLVSNILDELLDEVAPEDPAAVHVEILGHLTGLLSEPSGLVWSHHDRDHPHLIGMVPLVGHAGPLLGVCWLHLPLCRNS
jgi:hypothetical protein